MSVLVERMGAIEQLTLHRPDRVNALTRDMFEFLLDHFRSLERRRDVRAVLLTGAGRGFCSGLDLHAWSDILARDALDEIDALQQSAGALVRAMQAAPQPIIGLGHGAACGAGFALLLACDIRIGAPSLRMNVASLHIALSGADMGMSYLLPRIAGRGLAAELMLTGDFLDANRALAAGILSRIEDEQGLREAGLALGRRIASHSEAGVRLTKGALVAAPASLADAIALEDRQQMLLARSPEHRAAVRAFQQAGGAKAAGE